MSEETVSSRRAWLATGRGRGWLAARDAGATALGDVIALVLDDPRWDRQVEQRAGYYATLLAPHHADISAIAARLHERGSNESDAWLPIGVLGELARRGHVAALEALRCAESGPHGDHVGHELASMVSVAPIEPTHRGSAPRSRAARDVSEPSRCLDDVERALREQALRLETDPLARRSDGARERRERLRLLDSLPPEHSLPRARSWLDEPWPLSLAAERVLARHATDVDRPMIEAGVVEAHAGRDHYRLCSLVDALSTIGDAASLPVLCVVHDETAYSYGRGRALRALSAHREHVAVRERIREGLWDSESVSREIAADACDVSDRVARRRLCELADDPHEGERVREAAALALADEHTT